MLANYVFKDNIGSPTPDTDHTMQYEYDALNRLKGATAQNAADPPTVTHWDQDFTLDRWGNTTCSGSGLCTGITYESASNNRIYQVSSQTVTEDAAGNIIQDNSDTTAKYYAWDGEGRLMWVSSNSGSGACPSNAISCFVYNALGQRVEMKNGAGTSYSEYPYDAFGNMIALHNRTTFTQRTYYLGGRPFARHQGGKTYFLHPNNLGSTTFVTDETGATIQKTLHYPYGQRWWASATINDERFASMGQRDSATGNDPTLFRMNNSRLYRWLSPDPLAGTVLNPQSLNRYSYVGNNPVNFVDPLGLCAPGYDEACRQWLAGNEGRWDWIDGRCYIDGAPAPCFQANSMVSSGVGAECPDRFCTGLRYTADGQLQEWVPGGQRNYTLTDPDTGEIVGAFPGAIINAHWKTIARPGDAFNSILRFSGNFASGAGDFLSFGGTERIREWQGTNNLVNQKSGAYAAGFFTGIGVAAAGGALGAGKIAAGLETKIAIHGAHHAFSAVGAVPHLQVTWWLSGASWSHQAIRMPLTPWWP